MLRKQVKNLIGNLTSNEYDVLNRIEISRAALLQNLDIFQKIRPNIGVIPVIKANAYGHGLSVVTSILNDADCTFLAVDGYFEASKIRDITKHRILVLGYIKPDNVALVDIKKCSFVVQDQSCLEAFGGLDKEVNIQIELNTGMNRLGTSEDELKDYLNTLKKFSKLNLEGVMTHLADADNPDDDTFTQSQVSRFESMLQTIKDAGFDPQYVHVAQTAGSVKVTSKYANCMRLGIGLYGINPLSESDDDYQELTSLKPVLELKSTIIKMLDLKKGERVSYNGIYTATKDVRVGVLPIGYYEGVPRALSNRGSVSIGDLDPPIVGRVCMNHTMIELDGLEGNVGTEVVVISNNPNRRNSVKQLCKDHDLFSYELLTGLSSTIRRNIV